MIRGERFELDLNSDEEGNVAPPVSLPASFVGDVQERRPTTSSPPTAPTLKSNTGFPEHRKKPVESRFKRKQDSTRTHPNTTNGVATTIHVTDSVKSGSWEEEEKARIDQENQQKIATMSPDEIEEERRELMSSLSPAFIQRLMQRTNRQSGEQMQRILQQTNIDSGSNEANLTVEADVADKPPRIILDESSSAAVKEKKTVSFQAPQLEASQSHTKTQPSVRVDQDSMPTDDSVHFPRPPQPPPLDPSSDTFLEDLHEKYFPSLPADPDKLEWMQSATAPNTYDPKATALSPEQIRFSFKGELIPPRTAAEIPVTAGLHHHGDAPDSAGYTIPELAHLARSSYAAQRCIAFQTLGRFLYRLGKGEFGNAGHSTANSDGEDGLSELAKELWGVVDREKVIELLVMESEGQGIDKGRHLSAKAYATEAVWLWQKGGGRRWKAS